MKESNERYKKYYGIDIYDLSNYDVVIDSTGMTVQEEIDAVLDYVKKNIWGVLKNKKKNKNWNYLLFLYCQKLKQIIYHKCRPDNCL